VAQQVTSDILEMFSPARVMFVSDFLVDKPHLTSARALDQVIAATGPDAVDKILFQNDFLLHAF
tara:strand:- start:999 stop:1190 length:192 start_codon:yes stop_codon:yes gene_type:complete